MASRYRKNANYDETRTPPSVGTGDPSRKYAVNSWPTPEPSPFHQSNQAPSFSSNPTMASQKASTHNPNSAHFSKRYPCTFKGCGRRFDEKKSLNKHKDSEHDYCLTCDLDFEDDEALHVHKMQSNMHIICPICGIDFKSEPGRDRHAKQMHSAQQNVQCRGCFKVFAKGAALLLHFEQNQCKPLKAYNNPDEEVNQKQMLEAQRALMALELSIQQQEDQAKKPLDSIASSVVSESLDGGVRVQPSILDDPDTEKEFRNMVNLQPALLALRTNTSDTASMISTTTVKGPVGNWPVVGASAKGKSRAEGSEAEGMDQRMSVLSEPTWSQNLFPNSPETPVSADSVAPSGKLTAANLDSLNPSESGISSIPAGRLLEPDTLDNVFHCPFPKCEHKYIDKDALIVHIKTHQGIQNRCPACFRNFKTASALTAHMESASTRCKIRETQGYGNAISLVSGGFLGLSGRFEDGTAKMDSNKKPDSFW